MDVIVVDVVVAAVVMVVVMRGGVVKWRQGCRGVVYVGAGVASA